MQLQGTVVLITGASSGIGAATARAAADAGAKVVLAARRADRIDALAAELPEALAVPTDVTREGDVQAAVDRALERYGRVDVLINNAGQGLHEPLERVGLDDLRAVLELNVVAALAAMQAVIPPMRAQAAGSIVNVSSGTTLHLFPGVGGYAASKAALNTLSSVARLELAQEGIIVSTVFPFITDTEFHERLRAGALRPGMPKGHSAEQVAAVILDLVRSGDEQAILPPPGA
ncbi:SDR family NAD(P)-dependent oxidoreductase [uncultured Amnibacterium sp.]|uniref:SDR family NAD(P)-dependent oxidoreductase n=1 Tax=uncultured Amnibacterium sp. TaxID=1631851 RepID=UPI0035CC3587